MWGFRGSTRHEADDRARSLVDAKGSIIKRKNERPSPLSGSAFFAQRAVKKRVVVVETLLASKCR